jgi:hypothetical protein
MATHEMTLEEYHQEFGKPRQRASYTAREASEQQALFQWIETVTPREPRLAWAFHVPNGELRDKATAAKLQRMGVKPGVPDIWLPVPAPGHGYVGLVMELKTASGALSPVQADWLALLREARWSTWVAYGWVDAAKHICFYLEREPADMGLEATI